jgi:hypothetical protein
MSGRRTTIADNSAGPPNNPLPIKQVAVAPNSKILKFGSGSINTEE